MKRVVILHGTDFEKTGNQRNSNWFPWLKKELEIRGYKVILPELPQAWRPNLNRYWNFLKSNFVFDRESVIIGHSSGAAVILGLLQNLPKSIKIKAVVFVAGFIKDRGWGCQRVFPKKFDWKKIRNSVEKAYVIQADNDPYVPFADGVKIAKYLKTKLMVKKGQKHFSVGTMGSRYKKFPYLLKLFDKI